MHLLLSLPHPALTSHLVRLGLLAVVVLMAAYARWPLRARRAYGRRVMRPGPYGVNGMIVAVLVIVLVLRLLILV